MTAPAHELASPASTLAGCTIADALKLHCPLAAAGAPERVGQELACRLVRADSSQRHSRGAFSSRAIFDARPAALIRRFAQTPNFASPPPGHGLSISAIYAQHTRNTPEISITKQTCKLRSADV